MYVGAVGNRSDGGEAATADDLFRIGSITKTFTATVILQLVDEGDLALDGTVETYAPDLASTYPAIADLTIQQLLAMQSGIDDYFNVSNGITAEVVEDPMKVWTADELIAGAVNAGVQPPGTPGYSTTNYIILQEIAEQVTGSSLQDLIAQRLTGPLGLSDTVLPPNDDSTLADPHLNGLLGTSCIEELTMDGATAEAGTDTTDWSVSSGQGGGAMTSTVQDLGTWAASMSGNALLPDNLADQRMQTSDIGDGVQYGLGLMKFAGNWYGHEGETIGWEDLALHDPESGATFVIAANGCTVIGPIVMLASKIFPDTGFEDLLSG